MTQGRTITITTDDGPAEAYLTGADGAPGVLFYVDAIGLRPQIERMADRIAGWGYVVLAPHVFHRHGSAADLAPQADLRAPGERERFFGSGVGERMAALTPARAEADARAWMATLRAHAADGPVGTTGYCMGARLAVRTAGWYPDDVAAVGGWHGGGLVTDDPESPHLAIAASRAAYAFGHADHDASMPPEAVAALGEALRAAGRPASNEVFADAPHGYSMADTSMYDERAAEQHFTVLRALLDDALVD